MLFFAGDQTYHHTQHTAGWIEFGLQFRDLMKDRPTVTIPDDHDVGQANLWGERDFSYFSCGKQWRLFLSDSLCQYGATPANLAFT